MTREVALALLLATTLLPGAVAITASGSFVLDGALNLPSATLVKGDPIAAYLGGVESLSLQDMTATASSATIDIYQIEYLEVGEVAVEKRGGRSHVSFPVTNLTLTLVGDLQPGYVGIDFAGRTASTLSFASSGAARAARDTQWSSATSATGQEGDSHFHYVRSISGPHLLANAPGSFESTGPAKLKLLGMTVQLQSDENTTTVWTGDQVGAAQPQLGALPANTRIRQWMIISSPEITFRIDSAQPWNIAFPAGGVGWNGEAWFRSVEGSLKTPDGEYAADLRVARLTGAFNGDLIPEERDDRLVTTLTLSGDLESSSLTPATTGLSTPKLGGSPLALILGLVLGAAVGSTAGVFFLWRRRTVVPAGAPLRGAPPEEPSVNALPNLSPEYFVTLAEQYIQADDHARALHWITLASEAMPTSSIVASTRAYVLGEMGQYDEALVEYEKASRLDPVDGEADINAARLAVMAGKPPEVVEAFVLRALERTPEFVLDVEEDDSFKPLTKRPAFRKAISRAWDRWGGSGGGDGLQPR